jgi:hypothetical protein
VDLRTVWRPEQRRDVVARLRAKRWSTTRIAEAIGVSEWTVREDLSTSRNLEVESRIERACGGTHPSTMPAPSQIADRRDRAQELRTGSADGALAVLQSPTSSPGRPWFAKVRPSNSVGRPPGQNLENFSRSGQQRISPGFIGVCGLFLGYMIAKHLFGDHAFDRFPSAVVNCSRLHFLLV